MNQIVGRTEINGAQGHNNQQTGSESGTNTTTSHGMSLGQPYAADASNFGPTSLYHHHLNLHNHPQLNGFSGNAAAAAATGHYNLHHPHLHHHPYKTTTSANPTSSSSTSPGQQHAAANTLGSSGSSSRSPSEGDGATATGGMNAEYLGTYHPHQGFYSSLHHHHHHHNMNLAGHHHHPYQHMVRTNGTYIDFVPR